MFHAICLWIFRSRSEPRLTSNAIVWGRLAERSLLV